MNAMAYSREKGAEQARLAVEQSGLTEEQKAQAIAEYLAAQKARQENGNEPLPQEQMPDDTNE